MHKFFIDKDQIIEDKIKILGKDVKHIRDVLRLRINDNIILSSQGINFLCSIEEILKDEVVAKILEKNEGNNESNVEIILYQGLAKGNKMDLIIQKGTEIGIKDFYPIVTNRAVVKINDIKKEETKLDRWSLISEEAAKQSKRDYIPKIQRVLSFDDMIELLKGEKNIIVPYEDEEALTIGKSLESICDGKIHLIIGPEGGFEKEEIHRLKEIGGKIVTLGPRILRTETAGFVAATIILYELGDLGVI